MPGAIAVGTILGIPIGLFLNVLLGGLITVLLRIDENLKILVRLNGGQPVERDVEPSKK
jgi:hypothetical protein